MPDSLDPMTLAMLSGNPDALQTMRQYALAQQLQQMSLGGAQQPQQLGLEGKYPHASRIGPLSALAPLAEALMSRQGFKKAGPAMSQLMGSAYGIGSQSPPAPLTQAPPAADPNAQNVQPLVQRAPGQSFDQTVAGSQPPQQAWYSVPGLPDNAARLMAITNRAEWAKLKLGPESWQQMVRAYGDESSAAQAVQAKAQKEGTIELRSGGTALIPDGRGGYTRVRAPNLPPGFEPQYDAQGNYVGTQAAPGLAQGEGQVAGAKELAQTQNALHTLPTAGGGSRVVLGVPGDVGGGQPSGHFFPSSQQAPAGLSKTPPPQGTTPGIWDQVPARPTSNALGVDPYLEKRIRKMADKDDELSTKYGSEADLADQRIAFNNEALKILQSGSPEMGPLSARLTRVRQMAVEAGVPADWVPGAEKMNDTTELAKFAVRNPLLQLKPTFGSRPSTAEFQVLKTEANPSPEMLQGAYIKLAQLDNQAAGYTKQRAADYAYYTDSVKGNPQRFEGWYASKVPFAKWLSDNPSGRPGEAHVAIPHNYATEAEAQAARGRGEIASGDRIVVGGKPATWKD